MYVSKKKKVYVHCKLYDISQKWTLTILIATQFLITSNNKCDNHNNRLKYNNFELRQNSVKLYKTFFHALSRIQLGSQIEI